MEDGQGGTKRLSSTTVGFQTLGTSFPMTVLVDQDTPVDALIGTDAQRHCTTSKDQANT